MAKTTVIRSPLLSSKAVRKLLEHRNNHEFRRAFSFLDESGKRFDALVTIHQNPDPRVSPERNAFLFRTSLDQSQKLVKRQAQDVMVALRDLEKRVIDESWSAAGLREPIPEAHLQEIRASLRGMTQKQRDAAVAAAAERGDAATMQAVLNAPSEVTHGQLTISAESLARRMAEQINPDLPQLLDDINTAFDRVEGAAVSFHRDTHPLRDVVAETRGDEQMRRSEQARQMLASAPETSDAGASVD